VVVLHYAGGEDTLRCLAAVGASKYPAARTVLVDQSPGGGIDGTAERARLYHPWVTVVASPENRGWTGGNNRGARRVLEDGGADYLFFLNNDATVHPKMLGALVTEAERDPAVGILGPTVLRADAPESVWALGGQIGPRAASRLVGHGERYDAHTGRAPFDVDFVVGCGVLVRSAAFSALGGFDDRYFLYYDDADFCFRARTAGWAVRTVPAAAMRHRGGVSTGGPGAARTVYYMRRNALLFAERHGPIRDRLGLFAEAARLYAAWSLGPERADRSEHRRALVRALGDYVLRRFGGRY
jgi:GT2 family glycosyltransferase